MLTLTLTLARTERSLSHSHRDHAAVYCAWALLLPEPLAGGVALGVCVHFISSSGLAKLHVAAAGKGVRAGVAAWCSRATLTLASPIPIPNPHPHPTPDQVLARHAARCAPPIRRAVPLRRRAALTQAERLPNPNPKPYL